MGKRVLVGMLLLGALIIFALSTFYIENWQFYLGKGYRLRAWFQHAQTLMVGDEVRIAGVEVGRVQDLSVETQVRRGYPVRAVLWIQKDVQIRVQDTATVQVRSVFGGNYISITRGDPNAPALEDLDEIKNTGVEPSITELIAKAEVALDEASATFASAHRALENVEEITSGLKEGKGLIGKMLTDEQLASDAAELIEDAKAVAASLKKIAADLEAGKGTIGRMLTDDTLYVELEKAAVEGQQTLVAVRELVTEAREGKGILAKLLTDPKLAADLEQIVADTKTFSAAIADLSDTLGESTLGQLAQSDEAYRKLIELLDELGESATAISEGEGTLGLLIKDDKLHHQLSAALESVQKLLDEYREQSPVLTLMGAVFGAL